MAQFLLNNGMLWYVMLWAIYSSSVQVLKLTHKYKLFPRATIFPTYRPHYRCLALSFPTQMPEFIWPLMLASVNKHRYNKLFRYKETRLSADDEHSFWFRSSTPCRADSCYHGDHVPADRTARCSCSSISEICAPVRDGPSPLMTFLICTAPACNIIQLIN